MTTAYGQLSRGARSLFNCIVSISEGGNNYFAQMSRALCLPELELAGYVISRSLDRQGVYANVFPTEAGINEMMKWEIEEMKFKTYRTAME